MTTEKLNKDQLEKTWNRAIKDFFPDWKKSTSWKCEIDNELEIDRGGLCCSKEKTIRIAVNLNPKFLDLVLIHTICHANDGLRHDGRWCRRMSLAAETAKNIGMRDLAEQIEDDKLNCEGKSGKCEGLHLGFLSDASKHPNAYEGEIGLL